jgi:hypothetical protein
MRGRARELYESARAAFAAGRTSEAIEIDLKAFAANPRDPDVAGFLAFMHLRTQPLRAETARQLALLALCRTADRSAGRASRTGTRSRSRARSPAGRATRRVRTS